MASACATTHPMKVQPRNALITIIAPGCLALRTAAITVGRKYQRRADQGNDEQECHRQPPFEATARRLPPGLQLLRGGTRSRW